MPRRRRVDFPGAWHHVMSRGARKEPVFRVREDGWRFLDMLGDAAGKFELEAHAYSLMPNHFHLLVRSCKGNLSEGMQHLLARYTRWLNWRHDWDGPVFRDRFKSQLVGDERYLRVLVAYIHLNPVEAKMVNSVDDECWTSYRAYMGISPRPEWLTTSHFLKMLGGRKGLHAFMESYRTGRKEYPEDFEQETGMFTFEVSEESPVERAELTSCGDHGARDRFVQETLASILNLTGADLSQLRRNKKGPGANPARRFAIWALAQSGRLTHREIAEVLDVSLSRVGKTLWTLRNQGTREPVRDWMMAWHMSASESQFDDVSVSTTHRRAGSRQGKR